MYWFTIDLALLLQFAIMHSWLLTTPGRQFMGTLGNRTLQGTFYALLSSISLLLMFVCWVPSDSLVYTIHGPARFSAIAAYALAWLFMGWAMLATGALKQAGIEQWVNTLKSKPTRYEDPRSGPYKLVRHPIYLGMMGMIWFTPRMTSSHLLLAVVWTIYMVIGAIWKEQRMANRAGDYKVYMSSVPAFPFFPRAPLSEVFQLH